MHIPQQYAPTSRVPTSAAQRHREHLEHELRRTVYWRRLVQARLDLVVAGLLYAAPSPTQVATADMVRTDPLRPTHDPDDDDRTGAAPLSFEAPVGLDLSYLLDGSCRDRDGDGRGRCASGTPSDPGARLDRLREVSRLLADHERSVVAELHAVAPVLQERSVTRHPVGGGA